MPVAAAICEALGEYAMAEIIRGIVVNEQEHQIDLAAALGKDVTEVSTPAEMPGCRIAVDIVPLAVTDQFAASLLQFPEEGSPFHTSNSRGCCWAAAGAGERS
jgi:hypothetical protein